MVTTETPMRVAVIIGSSRQGRFGPTVARWFIARAGARADVVLDVLDVAELGLSVVHPAHRGPQEQAYAARLERADAFVIVTPEYNHGYPASLKHAIDLAKLEWSAKPVAFVSYGAVAGGLRAVEQLRQVFAELHCATIRDTVSFHDAWELFDEDGQLAEPAGHEAACKVLLDRLTWWGRALRTAREARPYEA